MAMELRLTRASLSLATEAWSVQLAPTAFMQGQDGRHVHNAVLEPTLLSTGPRAVLCAMAERTLLLMAALFAITVPLSSRYFRIP